MKYTKFGKTGIEVSKMCLGTWGIGGAGWDNYSDESRMDAIKAALDCGINFIDTAPAYNAGKAEQYVGETLHKLGARKRSCEFLRNVEMNLLMGNMSVVVQLIKS